MMHVKVDATRTEQSLAPSQETVGVLDSVGDNRMVLNYDMQNTFASALSDQLEDLDADVKEYHRKLRPRQYSAIPQIEK